MRVKHLIRELQKCDPEAEAWTYYQQGTYGESCVVEPGVLGQIIVRGRAGIKDDYQNGDDTPEPLGGKP